MKHKLQNLLKHNWRTLLLLCTLITTSQGALATDYWIRGTMNGWGSTKMPGGSLSLDLTGGTNYEFKITTADNTWDNDKVYGKNNTNPSCGASVALTKPGSNLSFTPSKTGQYTISFNGTNLTITCPATTYYVAGNGSGHSDGWCDNKDWDAAGSQMSGSTASIKFSNIAISSDLQFKVTIGSWSTSYGWDKYSSSKSTLSSHTTVSESGGNIKIQITTNPHDITIYYDGSNVYIKTEEISSCTPPTSASDITAISPSSEQTKTLGDGDAPSVTQSVTAICTNGDTYLWSASPNNITYKIGSTSYSTTRADFPNGTSTTKNATMNMYFEGEYTANFAVGCSNTSGANKNTSTIKVYPGTIYLNGPFFNGNDFNGSEYEAAGTNHNIAIVDSDNDHIFTYEWIATYTSGKFTIKTTARGGDATHILANYANLSLTGISKDSNGNHNLSPNIGTITAGDRLRLTIEYTGVDGSGVPEYDIKLKKIPVPTTADADHIDLTEAKLWGSYPTGAVYEDITYKGFYYGLTSDPDNLVENGAQTSGSLAKTIKKLNPGTTYYYKACVVSGGVEYCGSVLSFTTTPCSNPTISNSSQPSTTAREYCKDEAFPDALTVEASGGVGEYTYQWKQCATSGGSYTNVSAGSGGTTDTYTPSTATAGGLYYKCVVTNKDICTSNSVTSNASGKYTIDATSVGGSISGGSTSVCPGTTKNLKLGSYTGSIQWHSSSESGFTPSSTTAISGATSATYAAPISTAGTKYYKAVVKNGVCAAATSSQSYLTVKRSAVAGDYTLTNNAQTYDGTARAVTVTPASGAGAATVYYTGTGSTTYAKSTTAPTNAGSYSISIDAANGDDYCAATNLSLGSDTIKKATQETLTISNTATDLVYCDAADVKLTTSGGSGDGAVTYTVTSGSGSVDGDVLSPSAKGSVSVVADKAASTNYRGIKSAAKTFNFNKTAPTVYTLSNVGDATTICGDPSSGAGSGTLRLANSQTGYKYQLYSNGAPIEGYAAKAGTTGSSIDFPVTSSGTYTVYAYYGDNSTNCPTRMDGEITLTISTQPKLVRSAASVTEYMPVTITSVSTDIAEWKIVDGSGNDVSSSTAYLYDKTYDAISFKGASTNGSTAKTYTIKATTAGGCSATTTITVNPDTESCGG